MYFCKTDEIDIRRFLTPHCVESIMFELEIEREKKRCTEVMVQRGEEYTSLQRLCAIEGIPMFYKTFFAAHADWWIYELHQERILDRRFDYADQGIVTLLQEMDKVLRETVRFSADEFLSLLDTAVKARLNFLCRPRTTLKWFVFRGEPTKTIHEVWLRLNYFYDYQYLVKGFREWAEKTYSEHPSPELLSVVDFDHLITDIDNAMILELTPHQFTELLEPLYDFFAPSGQAHEDFALPIEALIIFLDDKGVDLIAKELERMYYEDGTDKINRHEFLDVVTGILSSLEDTETHISVEDNPPSPVSDEVQSVDADREEEAMLSREFDEANSGFLGLIHSYSQSRDYVSIDSEESAALYMAEFMRDDSFVFKTTDNSSKNNALKVEIPEEIPTEIIEEFDQHTPLIDDEEIILQETNDTQHVEILEETVSYLEEQEQDMLNETESENVIVDAEEISTSSLAIDEPLPDSEQSNVNDMQEHLEETAPETLPSQETDVVEEVVAAVDDDVKDEQIITEKISDEEVLSEAAAEEQSAISVAEIMPVQEQNARGYIPSLSSKIDTAKRDTFIKKIFHKDAELFDAFVKDIDRTYSWKEAAAAIDRFYVRHNIKDSGALAKELRTIIQKRYAR